MGQDRVNGTYSAEETFKIEGREEHTFQCDPKFVSTASLDFRLLPGSPAIGAGTSVPEVTDDFLAGSDRPPGHRASVQSNFLQEMTLPPLCR